jgi:hypothetical protein
VDDNDNNVLNEVSHHNKILLSVLLSAAPHTILLLQVCFSSYNVRVRFEMSSTPPSVTSLLAGTSGASRTTHYDRACSIDGEM